MKGLRLQPAQQACFRRKRFCVAASDPPGFRKGNTAM